MNPTQSSPIRVASIWSHAALRGMVLLCGVLAARAEAPKAGSLTGHVANSATHAFLQGATVELLGSGRSTHTDQFGKYTFLGLQPGNYSVAVGYLGLDASTQTVQVGPGEAATLDFLLSAEVYKLQTLEVTGVREGKAAALTEQRTAPSLITEVSLDSLGNLPNDNPGEMVIRLPGAAATLDQENNVNGVLIRGTPSTLTSFTVDGNLQATSGTYTRSFQTQNISGALFDAVQLVKAPTPDMMADSIGGSVNLKTRDPLSIQGGSEASYRIADRWAPPFFPETPTRRKHPSHPLLSAGYEGVFDVFGGERNLGIALNAFYSENATGYNQVGNNLYAQSLASPAYVYQYQNVDGYNNRKQTSGDLKVEYRAADTTTISLDVLFNNSFEPYNPIYTSTVTAAQTIAMIGPDGQPTGTGAILPGYTSYVTQVAAVPSSKMTLNSTEYSAINRSHTFALSAKSDLQRLHFQYGADYSSVHVNLGNGFANGIHTGGIFTMSVTGVGWTLDQTKSAIYPQFTQTSGPSIYDGANYGSGLMVTRNLTRDNDIFNANVDASYDLPTRFTSSVKAGYRIVGDRYFNGSNAFEWNYIGSAPLSSLADPTLETYDEQRTGRRLPFINSSEVASQIVANPGAWSQNLYYHTQQAYVGRSTVDEHVNAAYVQAQAQFGRLDVLTGIRMEKTSENNFGYVQSPVLSTSAQQAADPTGSAAADYGNPQTLTGGYTNYFPGLYLTYHITRALQLRANYSNGIGRPPGNDLIPSQTANTTTNTLTVNTASLKPEYASNIDADLEYYFEPVGQFSVGWFRKDIKDFITTATVGFIGSGQNNGFGGNYAGYSLVTDINAGTAVVDGVELAYQQQFTFLPGVLKGLGILANYTQLQTHGNFGGPANLASNQVANFVPKTGNFGLNYNYRRFGTRFLVNYTGRWLNTSSTNAAVLLYRYARTVANLGFDYELNRACSVSVDFTNLFNEPQGEYYAYPTRRGVTDFTYSTVTFAVSGKF